MKSVVLACLLVIASATALQPSEIASIPNAGFVTLKQELLCPFYFDAWRVPAHNRLVDIWILDRIERVTRWIKDRGLDPVNTDLEFDYDILNGLIEFEGMIEGLRFKGISTINVDNIYYNILLGRLDIDLFIPKIWLEIGNSAIRVVYGTFRADLEVNGSLVIENIRLAGNALLRLSGGSVAIVNINPNFSIERIEADVTVLESGNDYSSWINNLINVEIRNLLDIYENELNTIIGEAIRRVVNWRWPRY